jgi:hypothetical protein
MANRLNVTELDFDTIKTNLKNFLRNQSEFTDYDFEGSGLNVLLDVLAYNTHYNAYYLNMIANESFLDSSLLRNSVVSHAKRYGYTPRSASASKAVVNFTVNSGSSTPGSLILPAGYVFLSNLIDNKVYNFVTLNDVSVTKTANNFVFNNLNVYEGSLNFFSFTHSQSSNPKQIFAIPDSNIDTSTLRVSVQQSSSNTETIVYNLATDSINLTGDSEAYFLQEGLNQQYEIYFGDDIIGKKIPDGGIVNVTYLSTSGSIANRASSFVATSTISGFVNFSVTTIANSAGGSEKETVDQIKFAAPLQFTSQNRAVTKNDYVKIIQQRYPQFAAVNVWGGEENNPPIYGKIFISAKPKLGFEVTDTEKEFFINEVLKPISVLTVTPEFLDVDYNFVKLISTVYYDPTKTNLNINNLQTKVETAIVNFSNQNLNQFNSIFKSSKLRTDIDDSDSSIIANELEVFLSKRFRPELTSKNSYILDFGVELSRGTTLDNFYSSPTFTTLDENLVTRTCFFEEVPSSFTGVESITVINSGFNYTSTPTVQIVGDGQGAEATALIVNGKINSIKITKPGIGYTTAIVRIIGGGGSSAVAETVLENRFGQIRIAYFKPDEVTNSSTKVILNSADKNGVVGVIDYVLGKITINNFSPLDILNDFKELSINVRPKFTVIQSAKNKMLAFDSSDPTSVVTTFKSSVASGQVVVTNV